MSVRPSKISVSGGACRSLYATASTFSMMRRMFPWVTPVISESLHPLAMSSAMRAGYLLASCERKRRVSLWTAGFFVAVHAPQVQLGHLLILMLVAITHRNDLEAYQSRQSLTQSLRARDQQGAQYSQHDLGNEVYQASGHSWKARTKERTSDVRDVGSDASCAPIIPLAHKARAEIQHDD